jgi:hypothetical protein
MQNLRQLLNSGGPVFQVRHLERLPLGTSYPGVISHVARLLAKVPGAELAVDFTGVGRPVFDMFTHGGITPTGISITSGSQVKFDGNVVSVPKLSLISRLQALLHEGRLRIHREIPDAPALVRELQDYRVEFTDSGKLTFNARSGRHDDLVLALAIAVFVAHGGHMPNSGIFEFYREQAAALRGLPAPDREVVGVDLGQSRDPTAICVVRRVELPAGVRPPEPEPVPAEPAQDVKYAEGSMEWQAQQARAQKNAGYRLVRHAKDPGASVAGAHPGPVSGTWIVPSERVGELAAHGFQVASNEIVDAAGAPCPAEAEQVNDGR